MEEKIRFGNPTGRRVKVWFRNYNQFNHISHEVKLEYIEGEVLNFAFETGVVIDDKKYGFNIIPVNCIVYMLEVIDKVARIDKEILAYQEEMVKKLNKIFDCGDEEF